MVRWKWLRRVITLGLLLAVSTTANAFAAQSSSPHYGVDETFFGSGGELNACSSNYCSKQTAGDTAVGNSASPNYQIQAGSNVTDRQESLQLVVSNSAVDVGQLTNTSTHTGVAYFSVQSHLTSGYVIYTSSPGPKYGSYVMHPLSSPTASATGNEQFGMNVVANSCPANSSFTGLGSCSGSLGASPVQVPDNTFAFGTATTNYGQANKYMYRDGDAIAQSNQSTSTTNYTISYIFNITAVTPAGTYQMAQSLVATSTF